jgi:hypothetical protein
MFVEVTVYRKKTGTIIREYREKQVGYGGPNRSIVEIAEEVTKEYSIEFSITLMSITEFDFRAETSKLIREKTIIEKMTGVVFK